MNLTDLGWDDVFEKEFQPHREAGYVPARVAGQQRTGYTVIGAEGEWPADLPRRFLHKTADKSDLPAVGDWVAVELRPEEGRATIQAVLPRKSHFSRNVAGYRSRRSGGVLQRQVIVANVDIAFLMIGLDADFNLRRVERYLAVAADADVAPVLVLNKADLCDDVPARVAEVEAVAGGAPIHPTSALKGEGLDTLKAYLEPGRSVVLLGSSGVGKSTLINDLLGEQRLAVAEVRASDGRGMHTTTTRELIRLPGGGLVIDTPGLRELQLWTDTESLEEAFLDIEELAADCRFRDCSHQNEPGCAVREAIDQGRLDEDRLRSYWKLRKELRHLAARQDVHVDRQEKRRLRKLHTEYRKIARHRRRDREEE